SRPYLVSEFGPDGYWDDDRDHFDQTHGLLEGTAMEKAWDYAYRWRKYIQANQGWNIGGVAYCWSDRYEGTPTWFGMVDLDHRLKPAISAVQNAWRNPDPRLGGNFPYEGPKIIDMSFPTGPQWPHEPFIVKADVDLRGNNNPRYVWSVTGPGFDTDVGKITPLAAGVSASIELPATQGWYRVQLKVLGNSGLDEADVPVLVQDANTDVTAIEGYVQK
ncbi:MAG TPA: hypothetical protein VMD30_08135, partial [Tepidisphaeraceae bacterium]|nr:hypothetical protein [Tepidisphaeraceae bacterium]